jgi:hypothetical protein
MEEEKRAKVKMEYQNFFTMGSFLSFWMSFEFCAKSRNFCATSCAAGSYGIHFLRKPAGPEGSRRGARRAGWVRCRVEEAEPRPVATGGGA